MQKNKSSIELIILDMRFFIDDSLTFLEAYEACRLKNQAFVTNKNELTDIRTYAIEYNRCIFDLKKLLNTDESIEEVNVAIDFSNEFKSKRRLFFRKIFERLDSLYKKSFRDSIKNTSDKTNALARLYFRIIQKIARKSNHFIGHMESTRWHKSYLIEMLDNLVTLCNDFLGVFEGFCKVLLRLEREEITEDRKINEEADSELKLETSSSNYSEASTCSESTSKFGNYFSNLTYQKSQPCSCIFMILAVVILIILCFLVLPILRLFLNSSLSESSSVYTFDLDETAIRPLNDMSNEQKKLLQLVKLPSKLYTQVTSKNKTDSADDFKWDNIFDYMQDFYIFSASLTTFVSLEWLIKK
jgi:hypothetical protein